MLLDVRKGAGQMSRPQLGLPSAGPSLHPLQTLRRCRLTTRCRHSASGLICGMAIDKMKLFESTRDRWPTSFRISPNTRMLCFEARPELVAVYDAIGKSCTPTGEWTQLANWAFRQALRAVAKYVTTERAIRRGRRDPRDVRLLDTLQPIRRKLGSGAARVW
jgi:hypothetical protein